MVAGLWVGQTKPPARWGSARALGRPLGPHLACRWFGFRSRFFSFAAVLCLWLYWLNHLSAQTHFGSSPPSSRGPRGGASCPPPWGPAGEGGWSVWVGLVTHVSGPPRGRCWETELMGSSVCERRHTLAYAPLSAQSPSDGGIAGRGAGARHCGWGGGRCGSPTTTPFPPPISDGEEGAGRGGVGMVAGGRFGWAGGLDGAGSVRWVGEAVSD